MVHPLRSAADDHRYWWGPVVGLAIMAVLSLATPLLAQGPPTHSMLPAGLPPGAVGAQQLLRGGPLPGYFQPVEIRAPRGVLISLAEEGRFPQPQPAPLRVGLLVGQVYRFAVLNIPLHAGAEVFPTIEIVNRLYAPRGQEIRFPVIVELTQDDLNQALDGKFVTRVVYVEDPKQALPARAGGEGQGWFDVGPGKDPLAVADVLGRPMAIARLGGRVPEQQEEPDLGFLYGCPPVLKYPPRPAVPPPAPEKKNPAKTAARSGTDTGRTVR